MCARPIHLVALLALLLVAADARAQGADQLDRFLGRTVGAVKVQIEDRPVTSEQLLGLVDIKPGEPLTLESLRRTGDRFASDPRFDRVEILASETPAGVEIIFRLIPRHPVDDIDFEGDTGLDRAELERLVREQYGGLPTNVRAGDLEETVVRLLQGEGFRRAKAAARVAETHNPDRATLVFQVDAGPRSIIRSVAVEGSSRYAKDTIMQRTGAVPGAPFRERAIATALVKIRDDLRNRRYYGAIATYTPPPPEGTEIDLTLRVDAGPEVELRIEPADQMPRGNKDDYIPIQREGSIDPDLLDDAKNAIQAALRNEGYWRAEVQREQANPAPGKVVITFTIARGKRYRVAAVEIPSGLRLTTDLATKEPGLARGEWFSEVKARTALQRLVDAYYTQQGYYLVQLAPDFIGTAGQTPDEGGVIIRLNITEGPRAAITEIVFDLGEKPIVTETELRSVMTIRKGDPYVLARVQRDADAIQAHYASRGFQPTEFDVASKLSETLTDAAVTVTAREGPQLFVGEITVVGNDGVSRDTILNEITLRPGEAYSDEKRLESQRRLRQLGSFRSLRIMPEPRLPGESRLRITISVEELPKRTIGGGGGVEVGTGARTTVDGGREDHVQISPRAFFEIGRRNLGGRNRDINFFSRVALKPRIARGDPERDGRGFGFSEYRVTGTYRERYAFRSETDLLFGVTSEQAVRPTFSYLRRVANGDLSHTLSPRVSVSGRYALEFTRLFDRDPNDEQSFLIDRFFPQLRLSLLSGGILWNRRNDPISPTRGFQLGANGDMALTQIGSQAGFVKAFFEGSFFHPLRVTPARRVVFATRGQLGLARGFERARTRIDENGQEVIEIVKDIPANQRFFAGGSTTVRGFQLDRLGVPEILTVDGLSNGGNAEIVLNTEIRATLGKLYNRNLAVVGFVDGGQVFRLVSDMDLGRLRGTPGIGFRYDSPLGPVRLDFGFKLNRIVYGSGRRERGWEYHLSLGEAF